MKKLIITVAGVGAELTRQDTPFVPISPAEIIAEAVAVADLGATVFHLHVRDQDGKPTLALGRLQEVMDGIRTSTQLIIQVSTGGAIGDTAEARLRTLDLDVEMASLTLGDVPFGADIFANPPELVHALAEKMLARGIKPELEIFTVEMVETANQLIQKKLIAPPYHFNIILGGRGWLEATTANIKKIISLLPPNSSWSASGVGRFQTAMVRFGVENFGHVRTGLEDNIYVTKGLLAKGNVDLVKPIIAWTRQSGRRLATIMETKQLLGLK